VVSLQRLVGSLLAVILGVTLVMPDAGSVRAAPPSQVDAVSALLIAARSDLESLANQVVGDGMRPTGWTNDFDPANAGFVVNLRLDLEILAGSRLGEAERPAGWFGASQGTPYSVARDVRHDLEALADALLGPGVRPPVWIGADPVMSCDRDLQATVDWLRRTNAVFKLSDFPRGADYCPQVWEEVNLFIEILAPEEVPAGDLRMDTDALYRAILATDVFPAGWTDGFDMPSIRHDVDVLRDVTAQVGEPIADADWFGEIFGADWVVARGIRHDLEVLADAKLTYNTRPDGWTYTADSPVSSALMRCPRTTQNLARLLAKDAGFSPTTEVIEADFCQVVAQETDHYVESTAPQAQAQIQLQTVQPEIAPAASGQSPIIAPANAPAAAPVATTIGGLGGQATAPIAYLDRGARQRIGVIPRGTPFTAMARSSAPDSRMMYAGGEGFQVWIAWPFTTVTEQEYLTLPLADDVMDQLPQLVCFAAFCEQIIHNGDAMGRTPPNGEPGGGSVGVPNRNLQYLDYAHTRLLIDVNNVGENWAELRIEICSEIGNYNTCEPVLRLLEDGQVVRPVRTVGGHPVWRMTYHLHSTARLESRHYYVNQLWVTHPYD
jgi:hypothetical protein